LGKVRPLHPKTRRSIYLINAALLIIPLTYFGYQFVLRTARNLLIVQDHPSTADAIVVLGGGEPGRALQAADLYRKNLAPYVVITTEPPPHIYEKVQRDGVHIVLSYENYLRVLRGYGVPENKIYRLEPAVHDTLDELIQIKHFALDRGWNNLVIVTSNYHTRRARLVARYVLEPEIRTAVVASDYDNFSPDSWWTSQAQVQTFAVELEKLIAYSLYIGPRMLWKSHESTKPRNTSLAAPVSSSTRAC